jgi:hypothetical protein
LRRFELGRRDGQRRFSWLTSFVLHAALAVLAVTVAWQAPFRPRQVQKPEVRDWVVLPPVDGPRPVRPSAAASTNRRIVIASEPLPPPEPLDVPLRTPTTLTRAGGPLVSGPQLGDGRAWVSPRPALAADVAEALYGSGDTALANARVNARLHAMLDTLNRFIDAEQRARRRPTWGTTVGGIPFGLDSQFINIAGIKIPTMALALLGNLLPPGNYEGALRAREFEDMRQDLLRAAQRTETFRDFQKYVRELRARKQAERDADRARQTPPDTTRVIP